MSTTATFSVPFLDIQEQNRRIRPELDEAVEEVVSQGQFILGPAVERFEQALARYVGRSFAVGVNSGTSALHMALTACDVGPGDEVITTPHTWISTSWAVSYLGARPVFVDVDPVTYNINTDLIQAAITSRTKAIVPVHLYGQLCEMDALERIAEDHGLYLIEDAAQALGAAYGGRRAGSFGTASCFSFYPGKNLGAFGEGGAVVTDDERLAQRMCRLRDHAQLGRHHHVELGFNARMEGIQAAVLEVKLRYLDQWNRARAGHALEYMKLLSGISGLQLPRTRKLEAHAWHLFVVLVDAARRDQLRETLGERGVATGVHYPTPVPLQPAYAHLGYQPGDFPVAEDVMNRCLSLPMFPEMTDEQLQYVAEVLRFLTHGTPT